MIQHFCAVAVVRAIKDDQVLLETPYAELTLPIGDILKITMAEDSAERARRNASDVQAYLHTGGSMTFKLKEIMEDRLMGSSENFLGPVALNLEMVKGLEFNLYTDKRLEDNDDTVLGPAFDGYRREFKF